MPEHQSQRGVFVETQRHRLIHIVNDALEGSPIPNVNRLYWSIKVVDAVEELLRDFTEPAE